MKTRLRTVVVTTNRRLGLTLFQTTLPDRLLREDRCPEPLGVLPAPGSDMDDANEPQDHHHDHDDTDNPDSAIPGTHLGSPALSDCTLPSTSLSPIPPAVMTLCHDGALPRHRNAGRPQSMVSGASAHLGWRTTRRIQGGCDAARI